MAEQNAGWLIWLGALWLLWAPGWLLTRLLQLPTSTDRLVRLALHVGFGLAFWPILLLWSSTLGWHWSLTTAQRFVLAVSLITALGLTQQVWRDGRAGLERLRRSPALVAIICFIALLTVWTRILHIWYLALPAWVDSVHHSMIVRLLVEQGALPANYDPFIPTGRFFYHWGYHAVVAWLTWLLGRSEPLAVTQVILHFGQVLNSLVVLLVYAAGRVLFQSRRAGLLAAVLAGLISWFPAFYVSWGRYPQLAGWLVFAAFGILLWQVHVRPTWGRVLGVSILGAGLFLIHIRVLFFALTLFAVWVGWLLAHRSWRTVGRWALAGAGAMLLVLPWLWSLFDYSRSATLLAGTATEAGTEWQVAFYGIQADLLWAPHNRELLALASGGLTGVLGWGQMPLWGRILAGAWLIALLGLGLWQRFGSPAPFFLPILKRRRQLHITRPIWRPLALLLAWCSLTALLLNLDRLGLPRIAIVHNNAAIISLFVPLSLAGGGLLAWVISQVVVHRWAMPITALLVIIGSAWGAITIIEVVNPVTALAGAADLKAMNWIRTNTPPDAKFAVNVWPWIGQTYAGSDGGYWIHLLTDRETVMPPALYTSALPAAQIEEVNAWLAAWVQVTSLDDPSVRRKLQAAGVTHLYISSDRGHLRPAALRQQHFVELVYQDGPVYIFAWNAPAETQ